MSQSRGFTLIESVVAVSVFAFAMTGMVGVYTSVQRLNQKSAVLQLLQQNARFIVEDITKTVRNGSIDYARYPSGPSQPTATNLYLRDKDNQQIRIYRNQSAVGNIPPNNLILEKTGIGTTTYNSPQMRVLAAQFYIWPNTNPFTTLIDEQPTVTVYLDLEANINNRDILRLPFQFTVATKEYTE